MFITAVCIVFLIYHASLQNNGWYKRFPFLFVLVHSVKILFEPKEELRLYFVSFPFLNRHLRPGVMRHSKTYCYAY